MLESKMSGDVFETQCRCCAVYFFYVCAWCIRDSVYAPGEMASVCGARKFSATFRFRPKPHWARTRTVFI